MAFTLNIRTRALILLGIVLLPLVALGVFGSKMLTRSADLTKRAVTNQVQESRLVIETRDQLITAEYWAMQYAYQGQVGAKTRFGRLADQIDRNFERLKSLRHEEARALADSARVAWTSSRDVADEALELPPGPRDSTSVNPLENFHGPITEAIGSMTEVHDSTLEHTLRDAIEVSEEAAREVGRLSIALGLCFLAVLLTTWRLVRSIIRPLHALQVGVREIGNDNLEHRVEIGRQDELGHLAEGFNMMAEALSSSRSAIAEREQLFRSAFQASASGAILARPDGTIVLVNDAFAEMVGYDAAELIGVRTYDLTHPDDRRATVEPIEKLVRGELQRVQVEKRYVHRDGKVVHVLVTLGVARDTTTSSCLLIGQILDQSRAKEMEFEIRRAQKMEAVGHLAGGIAHDFNNLLAVIRNYTTFAIEDAGPEAACADDLNEVIRASDRGADLVRHLLSIAKPGTGNAESVEVNQLISTLGKMIRRSLPESVDLEIKVDPENGLFVWIDPSQLEQVILNLVVNARDAMPGGGSLVVETMLIADDEAATHGLTAEEVVAIRVIDSGTGMPPDVVERLFEPFFTTKQLGAGTGLGLATAAGIMREAGGRIGVHTEEGKGSTFSIFLPLTEPVHKAAPDVSDHVATEGSGTILVVDDEEPIGKIAERILEGTGYDVVRCGEAHAALDAITRKKIRPVALVTDVVMPEMSGPQLAAKVREILPALPVVYMSGYNEEIRERHGADSEEPLLNKPFGGPELVEAVQRAISISVNV